MEQKHTIAGALAINVTIRVRGMSHEGRFFDEQTTTTRVTTEFIVIHLRERVDLDTELHITNMRSQVGGAFRVSWTNTSLELDKYSYGLELLDPEGEIWEGLSIPTGRAEGDTAPPVLLECQKCFERISIPVPEADADSIDEGFAIARHCDTCKATTEWAFASAAPPAPEPPPPAEPLPPPSPSVPEYDPTDSSLDNRRKGRAPLHLLMKVIRNKYGSESTDICETINVSRTGVYFTTEQGYDVGEILGIVLPYHPDSVAIPIQAQVVRKDERPGSFEKRVAIQLMSGTDSPLSLTLPAAE